MLDFIADHGLRYPCMSGAMANGIGSVEIVEAMGRAGFLGVFGAGGPAAGGRRAGDRPDPARAWAMRRPMAMNLIHSPGEPRAGGGGRRPLPAAKGPAGRGVGLPEPDAAGGPLSGGGHSPRRLGPDRGAEPDHRQGLAGRGRLQVHGPAAGADPPGAGRGRRDHAPSRPSGPRGFRWPRTSPPRPTPAGTPTTSRRSSCCRRCWPCAIGCRPSTATTGRSGSGRPGGSRRPGRPPRRSRWGRRTS